MKMCPFCHRVCADNFDTCPDDQVPLSLSRDAARLHFNPIDSYYGGLGGIDWMESTLRSLEEVLAVTPSHEGAAALKAEVNRDLPAVAARADEFFLAAETRLTEGDLVGCLEILAGPKILRRKQALELRNRVRSRIEDGARADPRDERAKRLANELLSGLDDVYIEGMGTLDDLEYLSEGLAEVLFLTPEDVQTASWKKSLDESIRETRETADKSFRKGKEMIESGDLQGCIDLLGRSSLNMRSLQRLELQRRLREKILKGAEDNPELQALLSGRHAHWFLI